jgi:hypothetical protein
MAQTKKRYRLTPDEHGLFVIEESGLCVAGDIATISRDCCWRYRMVALPNVAGAVFKSLDGSVPRVTRVAPATFGGTGYDCVKVFYEVNPYAPLQSGGVYSGSSVLAYTIRWQQIGDLA